MNENNETGTIQPSAIKHKKGYSTDPKKAHYIQELGIKPMLVFIPSGHHLKDANKFCCPSGLISSLADMGWIKARGIITVKTRNQLWKLPPMALSYHPLLGRSWLCQLFHFTWWPQPEEKEKLKTPKALNLCLTLADWHVMKVTHHPVGALHPFYFLQCCQLVLWILFLMSPRKSSLIGLGFCLALERFHIMIALQKDGCFSFSSPFKCNSQNSDWNWLEIKTIWQQ